MSLLTDVADNIARASPREVGQEGEGQEIAARFPSSQGIGEPCACKRKSLRRLAATRLETPAPPRVPRVQFPPASVNEKKTARGGFFEYLVEAAGIEPASASTLQTVLHT